MACIYILCCPLSGAIRYVGKTSKDIRVRLKEHLSEARNLSLGRRGTWLRSLVSQGLTPLVYLDVEISTDEDWREAEKNRIKLYRSIGCDLVNGTEGGDGLYCPTAEVRQRMSASAKRRFSSEDSKDYLWQNGKKTGPLNKGKKRTADSRARISAAFRLRICSEETRKKMSATRIGRKYSQAHRDAIRAGKRRYEAERAAQIRS